MAFTFPYLTLSIWRCCKFLVIEAKSLQEDRRVLDRSNSDISELMLRRNQDKQLLHVHDDNKTYIGCQILGNSMSN